MTSTPGAPEAEFLRSALTPFPSQGALDGFMAWLEQRRAAQRFDVQLIPFSQLEKWAFNPATGDIEHASGRFFKVTGVRVETNFGPVRRWDQPIIDQPEVGLLGVLARKIDGVYHFLMQAKMEPGNVNLLQISPTLQATQSNYTKAHQGRLPTYLEQFINPAPGAVLVDQLQPEQGARFLGKRNRNMVVEAPGDIETHDDFHWLTLGQLRQLLKFDNLVNMDARTVLSCIPSPAGRPGTNVPGAGLHTMPEVMSWWGEMKSAFRLQATRLPLKDVKGWVRTPTDIRHETGRYFSVAAVKARAASREVVGWSQPILRHGDRGIVGFLVQRINGALHFLVRASLEPGNRDGVDLGPTVACSEPQVLRDAGASVPFLERFLAPTGRVRYKGLLSEEGGRFYHFQNTYMVVEAPPDERVAAPEGFIWMAFSQAQELKKAGAFNIEARSLFACLDFTAE